MIKMMEKLKIDDIVIVEGKDDVTKLNQVIDATIIPLHGSVGLSREKIEIIKQLSEKNNIILLTDPDFTGKRIRDKINSSVKSNIFNLYVPRSIATKKENVVVENVDKEELYRIFLEYLENKEEIIKKSTYKYTIKDLIEHNLTGTLDSKLRREVLGDLLKIGYFNSKSLINVLNGMCISYEEFCKKIIIMNNKLDRKEKVGIIFGKFIPVHNGHLNFIKEAAQLVDKLYVTLCVEKTRDDNLIFNSTLPKVITENDRYRFLKKELSGLFNVEILILREEGIETYPNGWLSWTKRVVELLEKNNIVINSIFSNETQDTVNYKKYFKGHKVFSKELDVHVMDPKRFAYNVSATKIRTNYEEYKNYLPKSVLDFLEK